MYFPCGSHLSKFPRTPDLPISVFSDQIILFGCEEGIYSLNTAQIHEGVMDQIFQRRTTWIYVINNIMMSLSGRICDQWYEIVSVVFELVKLSVWWIFSIPSWQTACVIFLWNLKFTSWFAVLGHGMFSLQGTAYKKNAIGSSLSLVAAAVML